MSIQIVQAKELSAMLWNIVNRKSSSVVNVIREKNSVVGVLKESFESDDGQYLVTGDGKHVCFTADEVTDVNFWLDIPVVTLNKMETSR